MKFSYRWLQTYFKDPLPPSEVLGRLITSHLAEVEAVERFGEDWVIEVNILPNRAHDCLSHRGLAREIAAMLKVALPREEAAAPRGAAALPFPVEVETPLVRSFRMALIKGVSVGPSPQWVADRLQALGQQSINNVVDATNLVLFELGQPVHAFDFSLLEKGVVARTARTGEKIVTLSGEECALVETDLVIADYLAPVAVAGVKGGKRAEISATTCDVLIEVGNFDPIAVRKTARRLGLLTDAAKRFENDVPLATSAHAFERALALAIELCGGSVAGSFIHDPNPPQLRTISASEGDITRLLGASISAEDITATFDRLGFSYTRAEDNFLITVPPERLDLLGPHDVAEEVARMVGLDRFPATLPTPLPIALHETFARMAAARETLVGAGYREVMTYTFQKRGDLEVAYGPKDRLKLRATLLDGLRESFSRNRQQAPLLDISEVKLFEIGTVFFEDREEIRVAMIDAKGEKELALEEFIPEVPTHYTLFSMPQETPFKPWSPYPFIVRDVAVWLARADEEKLETLLASHGMVQVVFGPKLFDTFEKGDKVSRAYRFIFQSEKETLTDATVNAEMETLHQKLTAAGFSIR